MGNEKKLIALSVSLLYASYVLTAFFKISANVVMPVFQSHFSLSSSQTGIITSFYYLSYAIIQIVTGPLCNRFGSLKIVGIGLLCSCTGSVCFAFHFSPAFIALGRFLVGVGVGTVFVGIVAFLTFHFTGRKYAIYSGLSVTCSGFGQFIASAPLKIFIEKFGITSVFLALAALMLLISVAMLSVSVHSEKNANAKTGILKQIKDGACYSFSHSLVFFLALLWMMYNSFQHSYQGLWSATYCALAFPDKAQSSGLSASLVSLGLMAGTALSEFMRFKSSSRRKSVIISEILFGISTVCVSLSHNINFAVMLACDFLLGFSIGHICIQMTAYTRNVAGNGMNATVIGFMNFFSCTGTILFQWLTGFSVDMMGGKSNSSFSTTFFLYSVLVVAIVCITVSLQKKNNITEL